MHAIYIVFTSSYALIIKHDSTNLCLFIAPLQNIAAYFHSYFSLKPLKGTLKNIERLIKPSLACLDYLLYNSKY